MIEKRFKKMDTIIDPFPIWDTVEEKGYNCTDTLDVLVDLLNEKQFTIKKQDIEIQSLNLHIEKLVDGDEISQLLMREYERSDALEKENEQLRKQVAEYEMILRQHEFAEKEGFK